MIYVGRQLGKSNTRRLLLEYISSLVNNTIRKDGNRLGRAKRIRLLKIFKG